ncbi:MAG: NAD(+)/NADH kinase [bacterium]|nr:NAD(+)/NADH kinase [bacterium]
MAKIGLVVRAGVQEAISLGKKLVTWAKENNHEILIEEESAKALGLSAPGITPSVIATSCDPVVALGGDGTLIGVGRYVTGKPPVMLGVNFGRLGFLTEIAPNELFGTLKTVMSGTAQFGSRHMLHCSVTRKGKNIFSMQAVNDAVIHKGVFDKLMEVELSVDNHKVTSIRCDGVIISTPTGSTAYSLSAGGPIVAPTLPVVLLTPICSHSLTHRPLVLSNESTLSLTVPKYDGEVALSIDGQEGIKIEIGDIVDIKKSPNSVIFVRSPSQTYFEILRRKLNWGVTGS